MIILVIKGSIWPLKIKLYTDELFNNDTKK
jgi:hypothetical protein